MIKNIKKPIHILVIVLSFLILVYLFKGSVGKSQYGGAVNSPVKEISDWDVSDVKSLLKQDYEGYSSGDKTKVRDKIKEFYVKGKLPDYAYIFPNTLWTGCYEHKPKYELEHKGYQYVILYHDSGNFKFPSKSDYSEIGNIKDAYNRSHIVTLGGCHSYGHGRDLVLAMPWNWVTNEGDLYPDKYIRTYDDCYAVDGNCTCNNTHEYGTCQIDYKNSYDDKKSMFCHC